MSDSEQFTIDIDALASRLKRAPHTIRQWVGRDDFPVELLPSRLGGRQKLVWCESQMGGLEEYARERSERRGWGGRTLA